MLLPAQDICGTRKVSDYDKRAFIVFFFPPSVPQRSWFLRRSGGRSNGPVHPSDRDRAGESRGHQGGIHWGTTQGDNDVANDSPYLSTVSSLDSAVVWKQNTWGIILKSLFLLPAGILQRGLFSNCKWMERKTDSLQERGPKMGTLSCKKRLIV